MSEESTLEQVAKLPGHARALIDRLNRELLSAEGELAELKKELSADTENSEVKYRRMMDDSRPLPAGAYVEFKVGAGWVKVMVRRERDGKQTLDVQGDSTLRITPQATNFFTVEHIPRY